MTLRDENPPIPLHGPTCRGDVRLGTACGHCARCKEFEQKAIEKMLPGYTQRPTRDQMFMWMAEVAALRSTCNRSRVGCIVTDADGLQAWFGYNGSPSKRPNRCARNEPGNCGCVHAEVNALLKAPGALPGKKLYTTLAPCESCASLILNANVTHVLVRTPYRERAGVALLEASGITIAYL